MLTYALENFPQMDYPYPIPPMPAKPVNHTCSVLVHATQQFSNSGDPHILIKAAAELTDLFFGYDGSTCIASPGIGGLGNTPGDGPGPGAWGFQSCTETLHQFSAHTLRAYDWTYNSSASICGSVYNGTVQPDRTKIAREFGGYSLADGSAGVSHLIWSQGTLDPWHGWFSSVKTPAAGSEIYHFLMEDSAHHLDLKRSNEADPPDVTAARAMYVHIMEKWISDFAAVSDISRQV
eukprot:TRINITY_DN4216_c0_g1_i4.p1 TRINITY_DN4216_c0_g1~~TRINITY_DN4216_c0_g1_i4.p1  ORF type:complete len:235 (-),score=37.09 TRINITY_DN4216_c0_g1_i4:385-1089(-)